MFSQFEPRITEFSKVTGRYTRTSIRPKLFRLDVSLIKVILTTNISDKPYCRVFFVIRRIDFGPGETTLGRIDVQARRPQLSAIPDKIG